MTGTGVSTVTLALSAAGTVLAVRILRRRRKERDEVVMGVLGPSIGALHLLMVAFALVSGWQNVSDADTSATDEGRRAVEAYWSARSVADPVGQAVQTDIRTYADTVVQREWPQMRHGQMGDASSLILDQARLTLLRMHTKNFDVEQRRLDTLDRVRDLSAVHDHRASLAGTRLPSLLLTGVVCTTLLMIGFPLLMGIDGSVQSIAWALVTSILFTVAALVVFAFSRPYAGAIGVRPGAMTDAQQSFDRIDAYPPSRIPNTKK
jgi:hypothetical protein